MGLSYVYKRLTPQDRAVIPFNAHKQYDFQSSSAAAFSVTHWSSSYTSESVSVYSSASSNDIGGGTFDPINNIKYNQIDHLYYRNYIKNPSRKKDLTNHNKQRRDLYKKANILSIPSGLYGFQIRKNSFYLSSSQYGVVDDSQGNLIISGTNVDNYPNDVQENVFRLDPIKGFKKYDLRVYDGYAIYNTYWNNGSQVSPAGGHTPTLDIIERKYWRQGLHNPAARDHYTTNNVKLNKDHNPYEDFDEDDSYFANEIHYNNAVFNESTLGSSTSKFSVIDFDSTTSSFVKMNHHEKINFNTKQDFSISFYIKPRSTASTGFMLSEKRYIMAKSTTKTIPGSGLLSGSNTNQINSSAGPQYPFEIYMRSQSLYFARSDGDDTDTINGEITASGTCQRTSHILCQVSSSKMQIWFDGTKIAEKTSILKGTTRNEANLYIGSRGPTTETDDTGTNNIKYFNGELSHINIWSRAYDPSPIVHISRSINASPYIGNIFYNSGFATITHPKYHEILNNGSSGIINTLQFQGSHLMWEHEYQCTVQEHEFNSTYNTSTRDTTGNYIAKFAGFTSSSFFKPYVTTIGLYNDAYELLAIAKLGQPIRRSDETDTTFVVRFDQ